MYFHAFLHISIFVANEEIEIVFGEQGDGAALVGQLYDELVCVGFGSCAGTGIDYLALFHTVVHFVGIAEEGDDDSVVTVLHARAGVESEEAVGAQRSVESFVVSGGRDTLDVRFVDIDNAQCRTDTLDGAGGGKRNVQLDAFDVVRLFSR